MAAEIQTLDARVSQLQRDVEALRVETAAAKDSGAQANQRLDNYCPYDYRCGGTH
ncbi:LPP leucine zipper domain-containing protein [Superficieibacter electus]|uniref:LPP leucine zipper domain-containing protein n=1 Tax=Superficieibacter electus TaxID=2022662 RepID=UPI003CCBFC60